MFPQRLKAQREHLKLTQEELAERIGVTGQQVYRWESGKNDATGELIVKLAEQMNTTADYLLGLSSDPTPEMFEVDLTEEERLLIVALRNRRAAQAIQAFAALSKEAE